MTKEQRLYIGVFLTGACVMVLELLGTRIVAPYIGSSLYVWTSLIGVILAFLSLGYFIGGELSKKKPTIIVLSDLVLATSVYVFLITLGKETILEYLISNVSSGYLQSIFASVILFAVPSLLLGAVSPYAARLLIHDVGSSGVSVGKLYAVSTAGSILGTFATGFWLVPAFGHIRILYGVAFCLVLVGLILSRDKWILKLVLSVLFLLAIMQTWTVRSGRVSQVILDTDTSYSRVWITDFLSQRGKERRLITDGAHSSGVVLGNKNELAFDYYRYYDLMFWYRKDVKNVLMIGGAGMGYPGYAVNRYSNLEMTVVEIDPKLYSLAISKMEYEPSKRVTMVFEDGRVFLNRNREVFDAVLLDIFSAYTIPPHLATVETVERIRRSLTKEGVVVVNLLGSIEGERSLTTQAMAATYRSVFPYVELFAVQDSQDKLSMQNIILVASAEKLDLDKNSLFPDGRELLENRIRMETGHPPLTDNWSPIDSYTVRSITD